MQNLNEEIVYFVFTEVLEAVGVDGCDLFDHRFDAVLRNDCDDVDLFLEEFQLLWKSISKSYCWRVHLQVKAP